MCMIYRVTVRMNLKFCWREFMDIMSHIKQDCLDHNRAMTSALGAPMSSGYITSLLGHGGAKLGAWHYCRKYYSHTVTGERQWDIPDDVCFLIPSK